jgi:hypothetical protein
MSVTTQEKLPPPQLGPGVPEPGHSHECGFDVRPFDHLSYLYGQMLTPSHLQRAQGSVYEKFRLHNRCLHGWGVVCGLEVEGIPAPAECPPESKPEEPSEQARQAARAADPQEQLKSPVPPVIYHNSASVRVRCGLAVDCRGHDLVLREPLKVDLYSALSWEDRQAVDDGQPRTLWVSLCFKLVGVERVRAVMPDQCGVGPDAFHAFQRECVQLRVTLDAPKHDDACDTCCGGCGAECVLLARIDGYQRGRGVGQIDNSVRRPLTRYLPTIVSGVNWHHGATYAPDDLDRLLWGPGLKVRFSRPVHAGTLVDGVCDVYVHSRHNQDIWVLDGEIVVGPETPPGSGMVSEFDYRGKDEENVDPGDRVLFLLRTAFVLDGCCVPLGGSPAGGLVPFIEGAEAPTPIASDPKIGCGAWPRHRVIWGPGSHVPGSHFESWLIAGDEHGGKQAGKKGR